MMPSSVEAADSVDDDGSLSEKASGSLGTILEPFCLVSPTLVIPWVRALC